MEGQQYCRCVSLSVVLLQAFCVVFDMAFNNSALLKKTNGRALSGTRKVVTDIKSTTCERTTFTQLASKKLHLMETSRSLSAEGIAPRIMCSILLNV